MRQDPAIPATAASGLAHLCRAASLTAARAHPAWIAGTAVLLALPSLSAGWLLDDHFLRIGLGTPSRFEDFFRGPLDLARYYDGNPQRTLALMDAGIAPWWTVPELKAAYWHPLAAVTHWLDFTLWPNAPWAMHAQNLLWWGLLAWAVAGLYRRFFGTAPVAGMSALLYVIDDARGTPVGWISNRPAILATLFGVLCLIAHDRWRRDKQTRWAFGAVVLLALALLSAEAGIGIVGYLTAYALMLETGRWPRRLLTLAPYALVIAAYRIVWTALGYGAHANGLYVDPIADPLRFAEALLVRGPILLLGQWGLPPSDVYAVASGTGVVLLALAGAGFLALLFVILRPLLQRDAVARFWAVGMLLAVVPICATGPSDRLLFFVGLGAMALMAQFLSCMWRSSGVGGRSELQRRPAGVLAMALIFVHVFLAPAVMMFRAAYPLGPPSLTRPFEVRVDLGEGIEVQDVILVNAPASLPGCALVIHRAADGRPVPRRVRVLGPAIPEVELTRLDERSLLIRAVEGFYPTPFDQHFRAGGFPLGAGARVQLPGMTAQILAIGRHERPTEVLFRFSTPLEDPQLRWLRWDAGEFVPYRPPAIGEREVLFGRFPALFGG